MVDHLTLEESHASVELEKVQAYYGDDSEQNLRQVQEFERAVEETFNKVDAGILRLEKRLDEIIAAVAALHP